MSKEKRKAHYQLEIRNKYNWRKKIGGLEALKFVATGDRKMSRTLNFESWTDKYNSSQNTLITETCENKSVIILKISSVLNLCVKQHPQQMESLKCKDIGRQGIWWLRRAIYHYLLGSARIPMPPANQSQSLFGNLRERTEVPCSVQKI